MADSKKKRNSTKQEEIMDAADFKKLVSETEEPKKPAGGKVLVNWDDFGDSVQDFLEILADGFEDKSGAKPPQAKKPEPKKKEPLLETPKMAEAAVKPKKRPAPEPQPEPNQPPAKVKPQPPKPTIKMPVVQPAKVCPPPFPFRVLDPYSVSATNPQPTISLFACGACCSDLQHRSVVELPGGRQLIQISICKKCVDVNTKVRRVLDYAAHN